MKLPEMPLVKWTIVKGPKLIKQKLTPEVLQELIAKLYDTTWEDIITTNREAHRVEARFIYSHFMKYHFKYSLKATASSLGLKDHTTIINALKEVQERMSSKDPYWYRFQKNVQTIEQAVQNPDRACAILAAQQNGFTIKALQQELARLYNTTWDRIISPDKSPDMIEARYLYTHFMKYYFSSTLKVTAKHLNRKSFDKLTVSLRRVREHLASSSPQWNQFKKNYRTIEQFTLKNNYHGH